MEVKKVWQIPSFKKIGNDCQSFYRQTFKLHKDKDKL